MKSAIPKNNDHPPKDTTLAEGGDIKICRKRGIVLFNFRVTRVPRNSRARRDGKNRGRRRGVTPITPGRGW